MEAIGLAVNAKVQDRGDDWRFAEIGRLAKIGEAIGRQRARAGESVEGFVSPEQRARFACNVPDGGAIYGQGGVGLYQGGNYANLGGVGGDPLLDDLAPAVPHRRFGGAQLVNPVPQGDEPVGSVLAPEACQLSSHPRGKGRHARRCVVGIVNRRQCHRLESVTANLFNGHPPGGGEMTGRGVEDELRRGLLAYTL